MAMDKKSAPTSLYRDRRSFAKIPDVMDVPNLIAIQTESFDWFKNEGLAQAFADVCPIENNTGDMCVEFGKHEFGEPKYTVDECKEKDVTGGNSLIQNNREHPRQKKLGNGAEKLDEQPHAHNAQTGAQIMQNCFH